MNRTLLATAVTTAAVLVPASGAFAADGTAPLKVKGTPSKNTELTFPLPDGWRNGAGDNRGVYRRTTTIGNATCEVSVVTRGQTSPLGLTRKGSTVSLRFDGSPVSFKALQRGDGWYRSSTTVDTTVTPLGWKATGAAELDVAEDAIVVLAQGHAVVTGATTDAERSQCATAARGQLAQGLRTILDGVDLQPR
ncbi:hypothetical protein OJ997_31260 [Solirubrobacter phytolaccae]|uniref:Secreted protein n=1 Tax=Solirubrobacter phytolaccae TaxID=1404360 RepID=A0A9X3NE55_9ACTN|nr:hypothetical protein [Solirubrobacter phytolaccae]MDA0184823.1 hypothetical protein [Solirubrobacter phytolaccae]